jgi:hypothetical protein
MRWPPGGNSTDVGIGFFPPCVLMLASLEVLQYIISNGRVTLERCTLTVDEKLRRFGKYSQAPH